MIKLINIINEEYNKRQTLGEMENYFNECIKMFYSEYKSQINDGTFLYPKFAIERLPGNQIGLCSYSWNNRTKEIIGDITIHLHTDYATNEMVKSVIFHETIHFIQANLKNHKLEPYPFGTDKSNAHDSFFFSECSRMNVVLGTDFIKKSATIDNFTDLSNSFYVYVVDKTNVDTSYQKLTGVGYVVCQSLTQNTTQELTLFRRFQYAKIYRFESTKKGWKLYPKISAGVSIMDLNKLTFENEFFELRDNNKLTELKFENQTFYIYGYYKLFNNKVDSVNANYSLKPNSGIRGEAIGLLNKYLNYDTSNTEYLYFEFETTDLLYSNVENYRKNGFAKYQLKSNVKQDLLDKYKNKFDFKYTESLTKND